MRLNKDSLLLLFVLFGILKFVSARPLLVRKDWESSMDFLSQYGYLGYNGPNQLLADNHLGIRTFQRDYGLNPTGRLDKATKEYINIKAKARCGVPDVAPPSNFVRVHNENGIGWQKWGKENLTYYFNCNHYLPKNNVPCNRKEFLKELRQAFELWSKVTNLNFIEIESKSDADIKVSFERQSHEGCRKYHDFDFDGPFDGKNGKKLAHAFSPQHQLNGTLHFDADENWNTANFPGIII